MTAEILEVGQKYNITLKKSLREALGIEPGRLLVAEVHGDSLSLRPLPRDIFGRLDELLGGIDGAELKRLAEQRMIQEAEISLGRKISNKRGE